MSKANQIARTTLCGIAVLLAAGVSCFAQAPADNPYRPVRGLARPEHSGGRMGQAARRPRDGPAGFGPCRHRW
jgi:hypothetical protein